MNAAIKFVVIPVVAAAAIAVGSTALASERKITTNAATLGPVETLSGKLAIALRDNDNVAGTFGIEGTERVAVWFKAEPDAGQISTLCTKAGELGVTVLHKMVVGINTLEPVTCP